MLKVAALEREMPPKRDQGARRRDLEICPRFADAPGDIDERTVLDFLDSKLAKWQMPDAVALVDKIRSTATGKVMKAELRQQMLRRGYEVVGGKREKQPSTGASPDSARRRLGFA